MPDHDLEPPRFAKRALEFILRDWPGLRAMILSGVVDTMTNNSNSEDDTAYINGQSGTTLLDRFTHNLFVRCNCDVSIISIYIILFLIMWALDTVNHISLFIHS